MVTASLADAGAAEQRFGSIADLTVLGVFGRPASPAVVDLRSPGPAVVRSEPATALSLDRAPGERTATKAIGLLIAETIERTGASTVAVGLGVRGGDELEACDAALLSRRRARKGIRWIVYAGGDPLDTGRVARRRMFLLVRGIRLAPVVLFDTPDATADPVQFWEVRS
ncbi:MAG TPA: hypothetical protein VIK61_11725 [Acidimicrobiia bacterium]